MWSEPISRTAVHLIQVPGGTLGPSGVLICSENWVAYRYIYINKVSFVYVYLLNTMCCILACTVERYVASCHQRATLMLLM
jgi:hypothetical protein